MRPDDDRLPRPLEVSILKEIGCEHEAALVPKSNRIVFPKYAPYQKVHIYRALSPTAPFTNRIATIDVTSTTIVNHVDGPLPVGTPYYYRVRGEGAAGALSAPSRTVVGTPYDDPIPPWGEVFINHTATTSDSVNVWVDLHSYGSASHYRISNTRITGAEPLHAISNRTLHTLSLPPVDPGRADVYVQFVKPSGLAGDPVRASIVIDRNGDADGDTTINRIDTDDDGDGLLDLDEIKLYWTDPFNPDTDGDGLSDSNEVVEVGSSPMLDDTDSDGLADGEETTTHGTDPTDADSDDDGIHDGWETDHGLSPTNIADGSLDLDGDGMTSYEEWLTGTDPNNTNSFFGVLDVQQAQGRIRLRFPSLRGRRYQLRYTDNVDTPNWQDGGVVTAEVFQTEFELPYPISSNVVLYQVRHLGP